MSRAGLRVAEDLWLPADVVTATLVAYGGKGMGKTNLGSVLVEELARCGLRWAWLDPLGVSWGVRHSADGRGRGVECLILGGVRGDLPIRPDDGAGVADVVVDESVNVLVDFSRKPSGEMWSVGEKVRFVTAYAHRLFQRQGELVDGRRREPLFQVLDEAARYIPQVIPSGAADLAKCVGAWEQLVEEGRNIGLGVGLITQRSARMNKSVSELADAMFAFRTVGPNSLGAVLDWLGEHVEKGRIRELAEQVRSLERGQALVVSPGWLRFEGVVRIRRRTTFDSSSTPKPGERPRAAKGEGAKPDLQKIRDRMAAAVEQAKAEDPRELRKRIAELERTLKARAVPAAPAPKVVERKVAALDRKTAALVATAIERFDTWAAKLTARLEQDLRDVRGDLDALARVIARRVPAEISPAPPGRGIAALIPDAAQPTRTPPPFGAGRTATGAPPPVRPAPPSSGAAPGGGLRRMLIALAQRPQGLTRQQLGVRAALSSRSGTFDTYLSRGRSEGWIVNAGHDGRLGITDAGLAALGDFEPLPTGQALLAHWLRELGGGAARMLQALAEVYPRTLTRDEVGEGAGLSARSGTFDTYLSRLRTLELVTGKAELRASDELFDVS